VKPVADGILGGPHTLDGFLDMARAAGVTRKYVPITWESDRVRADYGHLNLDVVVEDTLVRVVGTTPNPASWLGIVDVPDGQYRLEHGLLATQDDSGFLPQVFVICLLPLKCRRSGERDLRYACLLPTAYYVLDSGSEGAGFRCQVSGNRG
jgi:hypothetical protein